MLSSSAILPPVRAMLLARSRNPDLAADLQQDVMIEAICALRQGKLNDHEKLSQFVVAIARNLLNSHYRSNRRTEGLDLPTMSPISPAPPRRSKIMSVNRVLCMPSPASEHLDRTILQMTLVDGLKPGIIAQRLRLNPDMVRQRKKRATQRVIELVRPPSQKEPVSHTVVGRVT